jgi:uncharacterized protein YbjQ (UPF0145 family)
VELVLELLLFVVPLLVCGLLIGRTVERRHLAQLQAAESARGDFLVTQSKSFPHAAPSDAPPALLAAEVVIASDYLKTFLSAWRNLFGGEMRSFSLMVDRAKREALVRLVDQAQAAGYNGLCNVRIDTVDLGGLSSQGKAAMAACIATATAYRVQRP